jgi:hypothetical protein
MDCLQEKMKAMREAWLEMAETAIKTGKEEMTSWIFYNKSCI